MAKRGLLSWQQISNVVMNQYKSPDLVNGNTSSWSTLRLFGQSEDKVRVTLFRDHHAWCPYCQKVWLFLEEKKIPYKIRKVTMFCYGTKEDWYKRICPSGMLPALDIDGQIVTESDNILSVLENEFGPLHTSMHNQKAKELRQLERLIFQCWCRWLCYPAADLDDENFAKAKFTKVAKMVDTALAQTEGPFFLEDFSVVDCVFIPYLERMNASLYYYKGFTLRNSAEYVNITRWFDNLEMRSSYLGTQSDFHTHNHDLPPQMGGCYENMTEQQQICKQKVDSCTDNSLPEHGQKQPEMSKIIAVARVLKFRNNILKVNPCSDKEKMDEALRCSLTYLLTEELISGPKGTAAGLRYLKQRVNVPRDMPIWSARCLRQALESVAGLEGGDEKVDIPLKHRRDQDPTNFIQS